MATPTDQSQFSIGLRLTDLNDYITPSQACVKPVQPPPQKQTTQPRDNSKEKRAAIELGDGGELVEVTDGEATALKAATITLNDCLACSGCITSAETVLVTAQSADKFLSLAAEAAAEKRPCAVSVSPQSLASIAANYNVTLECAFRKLVSLFTSPPLSAAVVTDTAFAEDASIVAVGREFIDRYRSGKNVPVLASECPGWVCYAEKTHPEALPHISSVRSGMAAMGGLVKQRLGRNALHACVMPCFDKKLEASRDDFSDKETSTRDVDIVISTAEVVEVMAKLKVDFASLPEREVTPEVCPFANFDSAKGKLFWAGVSGSPSSGAGGYLDHVIAVAARDIIGAESIEDPRVSLTSSLGKNSDMREYTLKAADGSSRKEIKFASAYGFRNIQNVIRRIKAGTCPYHFVEIMACPQACLNGGGQIRPPKGTAPDAWIAKVKTVLDTRETRPAESNGPAVALLDAGSGISITTEYHSRQDKKASNPLQLQW